MVILNVIVWAVCMFVNYKLAQKQGRSVICCLTNRIGWNATNSLNC